MTRIHLVASAEIEDAFVWYLKRSGRVADNLSASLAEAFVKLQHQPLHYACFVGSSIKGTRRTQLISNLDYAFWGTASVASPLMMRQGRRS